MPGKTRRTRKYQNNKNRRPDRQSSPAGVTGTAETAQVAKAERPAAVLNASSSEVAVKSAAVVHPYITRELWTTGILAVIILVLLIILSGVF
jgi:preprotein translocase subunit SecF